MATVYSATKLESCQFQGRILVFCASSIEPSNVGLKRHMADVLYIFASKTDKFF